MSGAGLMEDGQTINAPLGHPLTVPCRLPGGALPRNHHLVTETSWQKWPSFSSPADDAGDAGDADQDRRPRNRRRTSSQRRHADQAPTSRVLMGSEMRFESIGERDDGLYRCSVLVVDKSRAVSPNQVDVSGDEPSNSTVPQATPDEDDETLVIHGGIIRIRVQVPAVLTDYPEARAVVPAASDGSPYEDGDEENGGGWRFKCSAYGRPVPTITWQIAANSTAQEAAYRISREKDARHGSTVRSAIRLVPAANGTLVAPVNVSCAASNEIAGREHRDARMFAVEPVRLWPGDGGDGDDGDDESRTDEARNGYCSRYTGSVCRGLLSNPSSVWFNISSSDETGGWLNEQIVHGLWDEVVRTLRQPCQNAAKKLLCLYAFPECHMDENGVAHRLPLCYEDCIATRQLFCVDEWSQLESDKERGFFLGSRGHFRLPRCEQLPRIGSRSSLFTPSASASSGARHDAPACSRAYLTQLVPAEVTTSCVKGRGRFYQGNVSVTKDGIPCQRWDAQEPHSHNRPPLNIFPEMQGAEDFCRNAGGEEPKPWCYTTDPLVRWQHCDIPQCGNSADVEVTLLPMEATFTPGFVLLLAGVGFLSLLIFFLLLLLCQRAFKYKHGYRLPSLHKESIDLEKLRDNSTYQCVGARIDPSLEKLEYPRNDIIYIRDLGQGAFGRVFQAKAPNLVKGEACTIVAVKTLKEEADEEMCANFEKEACLLAEMDHANIIALLGVCAVDKPMCLLLEYMELGDLRQYLRSCCPSNFIVSSPVASCRSSSRASSANSARSDAVKLSAADLASIGRQIASGMLYLSHRGFVHRDLATRNCLVRSNGPPTPTGQSGGVTVKIADFGLSQRARWRCGDQMCYAGTDNDAIPIRWMPLESIVFNRYTTASDVWAFGVCLWEVFSYAQQPYQGMSHEEVVRYLQAGGVLQAPVHAPCAVYAVMRSCWRQTPAERPSFAELHDELLAIEDALVDQEMKDRAICPAPAHV